MEESQRTYLQMNQREADQCEKLRNSYFCPGNLSVYEVSTFKTCESVLLNDPTAESLRTCEVQVSYKKHPYFKSIGSVGGWIYSFLEEVSANIVCLSKQTIKVQLYGIGILQIAPGCRLKTSGVTSFMNPDSTWTYLSCHQPYCKTSNLWACQKLRDK